MPVKFRSIHASLSAIVFAAVALPAIAQDSAATSHKRYCWRGQPKPNCDAFLLTESNYFRSVVIPTAKVHYYFSADSAQQSYYEVRDQDWNFTTEIGGMVNRSARTALGATLLLGASPDGATVGVKARYRRWLNADGVALDIGAGVRTSQSNRATYTYDANVPYREPGPSPAFTGDVAINARDYLALVARVDVAKFGNRYQPNVALGVRAGSKPAVIATGAILTTYALLLTVFLLSWDD